MRCTCLRASELGLPCSHMIALVSAVSDGLSRFWCLSQRKWFHKAWWISTLTSQSRPAWVTQRLTLSAEGLRELESQEVYPPPIPKVKATKEFKNKRKWNEKEIEEKIENARQTCGTMPKFHTCYGCGHKGHMLKTCKKPHWERIARFVLWFFHSLQCYCFCPFLWIFRIFPRIILMKILP